MKRLRLCLCVVYSLVCRLPEWHCFGLPLTAVCLSSRAWKEGPPLWVPSQVPSVVMGEIILLALVRARVMGVS